MELENEKTVELEETREAGMEENHGVQTELQSEADLTDHHEGDDHDEEHEQVDYSQFTKAQLIATVKELAKESDFKKIDHHLRNIKPLVDDFREQERTQALNRFILDGGNADDFYYRGDEHDATFDNLVKNIRDKRNQHIKNQEDQKTGNLNKKLELLEKLRALTDSEEVKDHFDQFKALQKEWRNIGQVPGTQAKTVWANYHALVDRFYDNQSIYFELKELDRKKNLEAKLELCARAEKLSEVEKIRDAVRELNELHHEFKHIGPVPIEDKENVWQRFKAASDAVYARRDVFMKELNEQLSVNLEKKKVLGEEVQVFASFQSDRIKEWNQKTKEILELQKKWEVLGGLPRNKAKDLNKKFWAAFKGFFANKNAFFKKLDASREQNLEKKNQLLQRALELKESTDWEKTTNELKSLQEQWKAIGPVPEKMREKTYQQFKEACDAFFENRRAQQGRREANQVGNLKAKQAICELLEKHAAEKTATPDILKELEEQFGNIGFVPKKDVNTIRTRYHETVEKFVQAIAGVSEQDKARMVLESQLHDLKNDPMGEQKIFHKEQSIRKKIQKVENDIAVWRNNLEFFARAKNGEKVREEFNEKIAEAGNHLDQLKQQLKLLRTVS
ncbi:MAG: DUF349 domain-containing protein [Cyclobacteriaceae bacterium]|nr:DUF349 domain-containing protein [Cyclobacteriaceae bacterium]